VYGERELLAADGCYLQGHYHGLSSRLKAQPPDLQVLFCWPDPEKERFFASRASRASFPFVFNGSAVTQPASLSQMRHVRHVVRHGDLLESPGPVTQVTQVTQNFLPYLAQTALNPFQTDF